MSWVKGKRPTTLLTGIISGQRRKKGILIAMINLCGKTC
jgi:hypothetical protein